MISGSLEMCSNKFYFFSSTNGDAVNSPNFVFFQDKLNWNFQRSGVLKYDNIRHSKVYHTN
jgi:hypothetical protein